MRERTSEAHAPGVPTPRLRLWLRNHALRHPSIFASIRGFFARLPARAPLPLPTSPTFRLRSMPMTPTRFPHAMRRRATALLGGIGMLILTGCASTAPWLTMDADALYGFAMERVERGEWNDAVASLERFLFSYPGDARQPEARMALGRAHFAKREFITSAAEFDRFLQRYPNHGLAPEASLERCRSYVELSPVSQRDQSYTERAVDACRETINEFPGLSVADTARTLQRQMIERLAEREYQDGFFYERRGLFDSAIIIYQDLVDFFPQTSWAPRGLHGLYRSYRAIRWDTEAEQVRERLLLNYPDSPEAAILRGQPTGADSPDSALEAVDAHR
jgi:outer membrane protein assembly factor BamD